LKTRDIKYLIIVTRCW